MDFRVKDFKFRDITNFVNFGNIFFKFVTKIIKIQKFCVQIGNFCVRVKDFKILKKSCKNCSPILGQILENFDFRILVESQSYDKPPWRNFDFWSNFEIFAKIENLKSLTLAEIQIFPNFQFWQICGFCSI